jgi:hypothetical protein
MPLVWSVMPRTTVASNHEAPLEHYRSEQLHLMREEIATYLVAYTELEGLKRRHFGKILLPS